MHTSPAAERRVTPDSNGQGLTEYALIAVIAIVALKFLGGKVTSVLRTVANSLSFSCHQC